MQNNMTPIPRMRTIKEAYCWLKEQDPSTSLSCNAFRKLVIQGKIPSMNVGNRRLLNVDLIIPILQKELNSGDTR